MLKKTITFTDYNDVEHTQDFYFNISRAELVEMELGTSGGYADMINRVVASKDAPTIMNVFKTFILKSYGVKSDDGVRFIKSEELTKAFTETEAYTELLMELCTKADAAAKFVTAVLPKFEPEDHKEKSFPAPANN